MKTGVLFLCTANACRSQIAEGLAKRLLPPEIEVFSAGTAPSTVDARAINVLGEWGIDGRAQRSKALADIPLDRVGLVITLCDSAKQQCPALSGIRHEHWAIDDPATSSNIGAFAEARDRIATRLMQLAEQTPVEPAVAIVGGSGFYALDGLSKTVRVSVDTPFGAPSSELVVGRLDGKKIVFLARHGEQHSLLPSEINARANIYALKRMGVTHVISVSAVGSLREAIAPGDIVVPRQFIDRTEGRPRTFFGGGVVAHISLADPVCGHLGDLLADNAREEGGKVHDAGTYVCIEGPQFSTRAESHTLRAAGADLVGMTNLPEARLAREAELCYATLALPTDYDCWRTTEEEVRVSDILATLKKNVELAKRVVARAVRALNVADPCSCRLALRTGLLTPPERISPALRSKLFAILRRQLAESESSV